MSDKNITEEIGENITIGFGTFIALFFLVSHFKLIVVTIVSLLALFSFFWFLGFLVKKIYLYLLNFLLNLLAYGGDKK